MADEIKVEMGCATFDALLADALDGTLDGAKQKSFERHKATCASCAAMFAEAEAGLNWLSKLDEVEPPRNLVHNILAVTSGTEVATGMAEVAARRPWHVRIFERLVPQLSPLMTSRFAMSFAMAFFSITMVLSMTGIRVSDIRKVDFSPRGVRKTYTDTEARVLRYYDNIRLVYMIESRVRDLKRAAGSGSEEKKESPKSEKRNDRDDDPERKQYQNYSREENAIVTAQLRTDAIAVLERGRV